MLSLFASSAAFQGPAMKAGGRSTAVQMRAEGEIGVTPPLGVYDPLNILATPVGWARARGAKRRGDILGAGEQSDSRTVSIRELYFETSNPAST